MTPGTDPRVAALSAVLRDHEPTDAVEARAVRRVLSLLDWLPRPFDEDADPTHVTASAIVVDGAGRVLLHRHKRLGVWLQPGGHVEAGETPAQAALRETREETGVSAAHPDDDPCLLHVDVHEGPKAHVHLDLRYGAYADRLPGGADDREAPVVAWMRPCHARQVADRSLAAALGSIGALTGGNASKSPSRSYVVSGRRGSAED